MNDSQAIPPVDQRYRELAAWGREPELNELDALMWRTERHPADSWTGVVIELLDCEPDWGHFERGARRSLQLVPRFREKVVEPILPIGPPLWAEDPNFDFDYHIRRVRLPEPGTMQQLLELAQSVALAPMDRSRPPWIRVVVEGLEGGRAASIMQCHHVLMDGAGYAQLMSRMYSPTREPTAPMPKQPTPALDARDNFDVTLEQVGKRAQGLPGLVAGAAKGVAGAITGPIDSAKYAGSLRRVLTPPVLEHESPLRGGSRTAWKFGTAECELADIKAAGKAAGGSVNDAFVAALLGGLHHYGETVGTPIEELAVSMPVSVRKPDDPMGGNRFAAAFVSMLTGGSAEDRIRMMRERIEQVRSEPALDFIGQLTPAMNRTPSIVVGAALRRINEMADITLSNWPGVKHDVYVAGAKVERMFVFGPLPGTAICAAMNSHAGTCCIGFNADGDVFDEPEVLWESMQAGLDEVLALAAPTAGAST